MIFYLLLHALTSIFFVECDTHEIKIEATEHESVKENMEHRKINTSFTTIIGQRYTFNKTKKGVSYLGIPFAKPPIGDRRFRPPEELEQSDWNDTFYALTSARSCAADIYESNFTGYSFWNPTNEVSEDCLQLNMWVPSKKDKVNDKKHCVIVYIYGGAFFSGSASLDVYNGSILAVISRCIVVNLNYRLGVLGFAFLNDGKTISGNMGLLDQQMGMKWVYENIEYFGGNKSNITIFGESAGSVSVISHLYANESHQYFKRIIANSGTVQNVWGRASNNYAHNKTLRFAKKLNCVKNFTSDKNYTKILLWLGCVKNFTQNPDYEKILYCLQHNVTTKNITDIGGGIQNNSTRVFEFVFEPIENDTVFFKGNLSEKIYKNELKRDVDIFIGKTSDEFTYFMPYYFYGSGRWNSK
uniref:Carboxylic ester hydrolase n=1 Tax=Parastrongyloides trichosuri TaxID=131310 RepID=A0A0N4ZAM9_PARTI